jgi:hypothetical protein
MTRTRIRKVLARGGAEDEQYGSHDGCLVTGARLHRHYRRYLQQQAALEFIGALYVNMALTTFIFWSYETVSLSGDAGVAGVLLGTGLILPIVVGFIVDARVRKHLSAGELAIPSSMRPGGIAARLLPASPWRRAVALPIPGVAAAVLVLLALWALGIDTIAFWPFVIFQGTFAGMLAAGIVVISGYRVIVEATGATVSPPAAQGSDATRKA